MRYLNQYWLRSLAALAACVLITPWVAAQDTQDPPVETPKPQQQTKDLPAEAQRKDESDRPRRKELPKPPEASTGTYRDRIDSDSPRTTEQRAEAPRRGRESVDAPRSADAPRFDRRRAALVARAQQLIRDGRFDEAAGLLTALKELQAEDARAEGDRRIGDRPEGREVEPREPALRDAPPREGGAGAVVELRPRLRPSADRPREDAASTAGLANRVDRLQNEMQDLRRELRNISELLARLAGDRDAPATGLRRGRTDDESRERIPESDRQPEVRERDRDREAPRRGAR